eukprot:GHVU01223645.1.p1 GENE.GHVU01223645.1~~GHVU01223645.1.p1  ORF type:complete len:153 (-),score=27.99 GHVU01223645.1:471-929(-)
MFARQAQRLLLLPSRGVAFAARAAPRLSCLSSTRGFAEGKEVPKVKLTDAAAQRLKQLGQTRGEPVYLRLSVTSGGCAGYRYEFSLETAKAAQDDRVYRSDNGGEVVVDETSDELITRCSVDYVDELIGSAFKVAANAEATTTCGCGESFDT